MWTEPSRTSNKRDLEEEEPEDFSQNQAKRVRFEELYEESIIPTKEKLEFIRNSPGPEGLYDPDKDLTEQFNTGGIADHTKRLLYLGELDINTLRYRRNKAYHTLKALEEGFLTSLEALIAGYLDPFEDLREEFASTRWNRIANVSVEGDERIDRIKTLCQIPKIFKEQGYYVLKKQEPDTVQAIKETLARVGTKQSTEEN